MKIVVFLAIFIKRILVRIVVAAADVPFQIIGEPIDTGNGCHRFAVIGSGISAEALASVILSADEP